MTPRGLRSYMLTVLPSPPACSALRPSASRATATQGPDAERHQCGPPARDRPGAWKDIVRRMKDKRAWNVPSLPCPAAEGRTTFRAGPPDLTNRWRTLIHDLTALGYFLPALPGLRLASRLFHPPYPYRKLIHSLSLRVVIGCISTMLGHEPHFPLVAKPASHPPMR